MHRIGIDLGGTKLEGIVLAEDGTQRVRRRVPTPRDYAATLEAIAALVASLEDEEGGATVGIGIPGSVSPTTGLVRNANSTWINGRPLQADLERVLGRPIRLRNDADCFALSEATDGAGRGTDSVFGVILGTGVGGGIVIEGRLWSGASCIAGEWGHIPLPSPGPVETPGPACWCGRAGCVETWLSGPGMSADHQRTSGATLRPEQIAEAAAAGDAQAARTLDRYTERLGRALATVVNVVDPEVVVLGGGVSNLAGLPEATEVVLHRHVFSDAPTTRVRRHVHGDSSGVRGAAWLWDDGITDGG